MSNIDKKEKLALIKIILDNRLKTFPDRDITWYGDTFDELYSKDVEVLKLISNLKTKK